MATTTTRSPPPTQGTTTTTPPKTQYYLLLYNLTSTLLWTAILGRLLLLLPLVGAENVYGGLGDFTKWTQTLAVLEIVHAAIGLVRSPVATTALQVLSRLFIVWPILSLSPLLAEAARPSPFYSSMLLAWSVTEVIRYSYFVVSLQGGFCSGPRQGSQRWGWLVWLRYNAFLVLYPLGVGSEMGLVWKASVAAGREAARVGGGGWWRMVQGGLWVVLGVYVPGLWVLFGHMVRQRRKVMRGKGVERR